MNFSAFGRDQSLSYLKNRDWDLVVIGGGVTGAAVARDAALRHLKVALVEAQDFASGTSSGSTKLIHGGLRYLENYEFGLVREAIHERELLHKLYAPFVRNADFVFPTYKRQPPARWKLHLGLFLYDSFSGFKQRHRNFSSQEAAESFPLLKSDGLTGACVYADSFAEDYRLVIELIKSAHRHGAICLSRMEVKGLQSQESGRLELSLLDRTTQEAFRIRAKSVINCSGPFSDRIRAMVGLPPTLKVTQGVHFIVPRHKLPVDKAYVLADPELHRILFAIPWGEITYLGTTDTDIAQPEAAQAKASDLNYVLKIVNRYFKMQLQASDVFQSWTGVRPLIRPKSDSASNSEVSREHLIEENPVNVFHVLGGKLTSHRSMAAEVMDQLHALGRLEKCRTDQLPLQDALWDESVQSQPAHLVRTYGRFYSDVQKMDRERKLDLETLKGGSAHLKAEVLYAIHHEMALEPMDFIKRRSTVFYETDWSLPSHQESLRDILNLFAQEYQWSETQKKISWETIERAFQWDREGYRS